MNPTSCRDWWGTFLAVIGGGAEVGKPFFNDFAASRLDNHHNVTESSCRDLGIVVAQVAPTGGGDPDFCGIVGGSALGDVDVDRLQGIVFI